MAVAANSSGLDAQMTLLAPSLTRARAVALLTELLEAFKSRSFQKKLGKLISKGSVAEVSGPIRHVEGRRALVFAVQRDVLLRYGFSVDEEGVVAMKAALRAHLEDSEILELSRAARLELRVPQMQLLKSAIPCASSDEFSFIASPDAPDVSKAPPVAPSPSLAPTPLISHAVHVEQKVTNMTIKVTNPETQQKLVITVPKPLVGYPTVADVKSAISAHLGDAGAAKGSVDPSTFQLVISNGGGMYGTRGDKEAVRIDRVSALGFNVAAAAGA